MAIRIYIAKIIRKMGTALHRISARIYLSPAERRIIPWIDISGDMTLRQEYDLDESSVVFDVGGYEGQWASDIYSRYEPTIHVFEPVPVFFEQIQKRFRKNKKIICHAFGLSKKTADISMNISSDSSSAFKGNTSMTQVHMKDIMEFLSTHHIDSIDLLKINIEGGEYDLLERLIATPHIRRVRHIQVQFHDFVPDAKNRMERIQKTLAKTHRPTYQFEFVWEGWTSKEYL